MPDVLQIGPLMLRWDMLVLILSVIAGYFIMKRKIKLSERPETEIAVESLSETPMASPIDLRMETRIMSELFNFFIIVFVFWKFAYVFSEPAVLWKDPYKLLLIKGTLHDAMIGGIAALIYLTMRHRKSPHFIRVCFDLIPYGILSTIALMNLLSWRYGSLTTLPWGISVRDPRYHYHPINIYMLVITLPMLIRLWSSSYILGKGDVLRDFLAFYGIGLMVVSLFKPQETVLLFLSQEQLIYIIMVVVGSVLPLFLKKL